MRTIVTWEGDTPKDFEDCGDLPEAEFECGRLRKGDKIELLIDHPGGFSGTYYARVAKVIISIDLAPGEGEEEISAIQWVYLKR